MPLEKEEIDLIEAKFEAWLTEMLPPVPGQLQFPAVRTVPLFRNFQPNCKTARSACRLLAARI
jgi:hypothetical protein